MKTIKVIRGEFEVPKRFELTEKKRKLHIKMPYVSRLSRLKKNNFQVSIQCWYRHKPQKPFVPEDHIEIDGELFKVVEENGKNNKRK